MTQHHLQIDAKPQPIIPWLIALLTLCSTLAWAGPGKNKKYKNWQPPENVWLAYSVGKKGRMKPIELPIEANKDKDWVVVRYTQYQGFRPRVAVLDFINEASNQTAGTMSQTVENGDQKASIEISLKTEVPVSAIEELMASSLSGSNRFALVERNHNDKILKELKFSNSKHVSKESATTLGKLLSARFLIIGTVNEWSPKKKSMGAIGIGGKTISEVALSIKLIEVQTGTVLLALTERAKSGSWGLGLAATPGTSGLLAGMGGDSPINYAVSAAINKLTYRLCLFIKDLKWQGAVIKVGGVDRVFINGTKAHGLEIGQELEVFALGEELVDPETGEVLDSEEELIGTVEITDIKTKYSIAKVKTGCLGIKRLDRVKIRGEITQPTGPN